MTLETIDNKVALVTGGGRGLGLHTARALHEAGAIVAITSRSSAALSAAAASVGPRCYAFVCDQNDPAAIESMAKRVTDELGELDILVNNAAAMRFAPVDDLELDLWNEVIGTNLTGVYLTTRAFLPGMRRRGRGDIFMISSMSGKSGDPGSAAYSASKFGLQGFSQSLLKEVRRSNIRVMILNPSSINTGDDSGPEHGPGLHLHACDVADTIVHLCRLPGRTLFRDMDIWGTNPFPSEA